VTHSQNGMTCPLSVWALFRNLAEGVRTIEGVGDNETKNDRPTLIKHCNDIIEAETTEHHRRFVKLCRDCRRRPWRYLDGAVGPSGLNWLTLVSKRGSRCCHCCASPRICAGSSCNGVIEEILD
jgi:hypothetical protein